MCFNFFPLPTVWNMHTMVAAAILWLCGKLEDGNQDSRIQPAGLPQRVFLLFPGSLWTVEVSWIASNNYNLEVLREAITVLGERFWSMLALVFNVLGSFFSWPINSEAFMPKRPLWAALCHSFLTLGDFCLRKCSEGPANATGRKLKTTNERGRNLAVQTHKVSLPLIC